MNYNIEKIAKIIAYDAVNAIFHSFVINIPFYMPHRIVQAFQCLCSIQTPLITYVCFQ